MIERYRIESEKLFSEWSKKYPGAFVKDGVIDPENFYSSNKRILFLTKETNDGDVIEDYDLCEAIINPDEYKPFIRHLTQWTWAINEDFPPARDFTDEVKNKYINAFALINLKKESGGKETSNNTEILESFEKDRDFIERQIEIINPDIIVGLWSCSVKDKISLPENVKHIDFYHPSYYRYSDQHFIDELKNCFSNVI